MKEVSAVDLFCGAGGLTHGLLKSGVAVVAGYDIDIQCRYAYEKNNKGAVFYDDDVSNIKSKDVKSLYPKESIKLLAGCAPCQPFSTYSQGRDVRRDKKWPLLFEFSRLIKGVLPEIVTMENVPDVSRHEVYQDFVSNLLGLNYSVWAETVFCPNYGIPQLRKRHVLLASRLGSISLIEPTTKPNNYKTVEQAIRKLPPLIAGGRDPKDPLHVCASLSELNLRRIQESKPGGSWKDWPEELVAECHKKSSGKTYGGVYARMRWDEPSPTMTTQCFGFGNGRFGHPEQDRAISLREAAMLQTFPKKYAFVPSQGKVELAPVGRMIGNAVPVKLGLVIGKSIKAHVQNLQ